MLTKTLVLLTLNEIQGLKSLWDKIPLGSADYVVAVDGGSQDGTREFLTGKGIKILDQEKPGRGEAFRTALLKSKGDVFLFFSPDGNEDPDDIPLLFAKIQDGADLVIASRFMRGSRNEEDDSFFKWRAWVNRSFTWLANLLWNTREDYISDTINGFRAIRKDVLKRLNTDVERFPIEYQISIRSMKLNLNIAEIPTREGDRIGGESKAKSFPVGWDHVQVLLKEMVNGKSFEA